jgi:hypothetical protein
MEALPGTEAQLIFTERKTCRACHGKALTSVLDLGTQYLPRFPEAPDDTLPKAPLHLVRCALCGLLQLQHSVDPDLLYREFWYRSGVNATMREALDDVVKSGLKFHKEGTWLDIGANDGYLLSRVPDNFTRIACEPAVNFEDQLLEHAHIVVPDYFSAAAVRDRYDEKCDVITSAACFYDVSEPSDFVRDIAALLNDRGIWINQLNDSPTMLERNAFDSICHEHVCYYDVPTLKELYRQHGLTINEITYNEVNGGSIRVFASKDGERHPADFLGHKSASAERCEAFAKRTVRWKEQVGSLLKYSDLFRYTPIWLYGASTKGGTLLQYLDCNDSFLACADRNAAKWGRRMVGGWIPITEETAMRKAKPKFLLVLPWAFAEEFNAREALLRQAGTTMIYPLPDFRLVM